MKKLVFAAGFLVFGTLITSAQSAQFGLKAGLNVADFAIKNGVDYSARASVHVGGLVHIHLDPNWAVQPELVYSSEGGQRDGLVARLGYINVPILLQYMTRDGFRFETGPQIGFLTSAVSDDGTETIDQKSQIKKTDLAWALGASYLTKSGFGIDARYNFGLTNIRVSTPPEVRNMVFQLGAFYQFKH